MHPSTPMATSGRSRFEILDPPQSAVNLVLGVLANRAGVEKDRVRLIHVGRQVIPFLAEPRDDQFAVQNIHLAANGFNIQLLAGGTGVALHRVTPGG